MEKLIVLLFCLLSSVALAKGGGGHASFGGHTSGHASGAHESAPSNHAEPVHAAEKITPKTITPTKVYVNNCTSEKIKNDNRKCN